MIGGSFTTVNEADSPHLAMLTPDGTLDLTFRCYPDNAVSFIRETVLGDLFVAGEFYKIVAGFPQPIPSYHNGLMLVRPNGTIIGGDAGQDASITCAAVQADGKIVVGGWLKINGVLTSGVARFTSEAAFDSSFSPATVAGSGASIPVKAIGIEADGKIVFGGDFLAVNHKARVNLARLNSDGSLDQAFVPAEAPVLGLWPRPAGRILVATETPSPNPARLPGITRLLNDGSTDDCFADTLTAFTRSLAVDQRGAAWVGGYFGQNALLKVFLEADPLTIYGPVKSTPFSACIGTVAGKTYILERASDATGAAWQEQMRMAGTGASENFTDPGPADERAFYRVRVTQP